MEIEIYTPENPACDYTIREIGDPVLMRNFNNEHSRQWKFSDVEMGVILGIEKYRKFSKKVVTRFRVSRGKFDLIRGARKPITKRDNFLLSQL